MKFPAVLHADVGIEKRGGDFRFAHCLGGLLDFGLGHVTHERGHLFQMLQCVFVKHVNIGFRRKPAIRVADSIESTKGGFMMYQKTAPQLLRKAHGPSGVNFSHDSRCILGGQPPFVDAVFDAPARDTRRSGVYLQAK